MVSVARAQQKALGFATSVCALALIARLTLTPHGGPLPSGFHWCVLCGSFGLADFLLNVALFVPLGWGLHMAGVRRWPIYLFGFVLAVTIETLQDFVISGRESALNDIIANPLGGIIGVWLADHMRLIVLPDSKTGRRLALGAAAAWIGLAAVVPWLMGPSLPRTQYWEQVAADLPKFGKYRGQILSATYNGQTFRNGRLSDSASAAMRDAFLQGRARVDITTIPQPNVGGRLAPIVGVFDGEREEIFMVACAGTDLVFGVRTRLDDFKLHSPAHRLHGVIPCEAGDAAPATSDTIRIHAAVDRIGPTLSAERDGRVARSRPDAGAWQAWRFLVSDAYGRQAPFAHAITALWLVLWMVPFAYWLGRAAWPFPVSIALVGLATGLTLVIIPALAGSPLAPGLVWLVALAGLAVGIALGHRSRVS